MTVNGQHLRFELDTGADVTIGTIQDWLTLGKLRLTQSHDQLSGYNGQAIHVRGMCTVDVNYSGQTYALPLYFVQGNGSSLCGKNWIDSLKIDLNETYYGSSPPVNVKPLQVNRVYSESKLASVLDKYTATFSPGLGRCNKAHAKLHLRPDARPRFFKPRPVPFARLQSTKEELQRNVDMGVLEKIDFNKRGYAAPIVVVAKPNGKVGICGDFKVTVNQQIHVDEHAIPTIDEIFTKMNGGEKFSNLDLADAYLQVELEEDSKDLLAINTPFGLYRYNRMPFGIASAPAIFQRIMDQLLADVPYCAAYLDDILISGRTEEEHIATLEQVLSRLQDAGLKCNREKCSFFKDEVKYLGHIISAEGKRPDPSKTSAILKMPAPTSADEVSSFLGKINFYSRFLSDYTDLCAPLYELKQKGKKFIWSKLCQNNFDQLKSALAKATCLVHYDPKLPLLLATDASSYGVGAVLSHRYSDGTEKPIAFASKTLEPAEKNYSQIEKEGLSIIFGLKKFEQFLIGRHFELITDHRPLVSIFNPEKGIPASSANRLQRWALRLMGFDYKIVYRATKQHGNADALSRLPMGPDPSFSDKDSLKIHTIQQEALDRSPLKLDDVIAATKQSSDLQQVIKWIQHGWPKMEPFHAHLLPFFRQKDVLSEQHGVILRYNQQVVIPPPLQSITLCKLHYAHAGTVKMKQAARTYVWWPGIDQHIEALVKKCFPCSQVAPRPAPVYQPWPDPDQPWERVHIDFAGPFMGEKWLIVIDAKSKFAFVQPMGNDTTAKRTIKALEEIFDVMGPCTTIVTDNGPPFNSKEMVDFYNKYAIDHVTAPPFHPASNGLAERFVRTFKEGMLKMKLSGQNDRLKALRSILRDYNWSPHSTTLIAPAQMMFQRQIRTELSALLQKKPKEKSTNIQKDVYHNGQAVWVNIAIPGNRAEWSAGWIEKRIGKVLYMILMEKGSHRKAHCNQLRPRIPDETAVTADEYTPSLITPFIATDAPTSLPDVTTTDTDPDVLDEEEAQDQPESLEDNNIVIPDTLVTTRRYPARNRQPPERYTPSLDPECSPPWSGLPVTQLAIIEVWLTLIEGLTAVAVTCSRSLQPELLQALSDMIESLRSCPGPDFGAYCLSHLLLPMLQNWLRREALVEGGSGWRENRPSVRNFKQAFGLYTEVIVGFVRHDPARSSSRRLLLDLYQLINECIAQPSEFISRLGCSCLRHLITCAGPAFGEEEWSITVQALWKTTCVTLHQLRLLMAHFFPGSNEYYGDCGVVQVALRKDSNPREASRVRTLAQQVFLLDNQKFVENLEDRPDLLSQSDRSVVFLLNREKRSDEQSAVHRLPFRDIVVLLLSHQLLLQLIGSLLVEGTDLIVSGVGSLLLKQLVSSSSAAKTKKASLPGVMTKLSASSITTLYLCLDASFQVAYEFDRRPGLKFLVQKVFNSTVAANLYKQAVTAWTLRSVAMFEFVRRVDKSPKDVWALFKDWGDEYSLEESALRQDTDYLLRLADAFRRICRELCRVERTVAAEKPIIIDEQAEPLAFVLASPDVLPSSSTLSANDDENDETEGAARDKEVVYSVVTTENVSDMIAEYKRRKQQATMPSTPPRARANPFRHSADGEDGNGCLEEEQKESKLKDGDARCLAWSEMTLGVVHLLMSQPTPCFKKLLPMFYKSLMLLTAGSADVRVRQTIADLFALLEETFHFLESD
uniref:RNA-directed DNA polymerase n=1 Tax=Plectus sambesii TaxID=2011161 RepID=A0A914WMU4_9BILA